MRKIRDIFDLVKIVAGTKDPMSIDIKKGHTTNSIRKIASKSILQFPLLVSNNVPADVLKDLSRSLEGEYATLVKLAMENDDNQILNIDDPNKAQPAKHEYIKRFHSNIHTASIREAVELLENTETAHILVKMLGESKDITLNKASIELLTPISEDVNNAILNDMFNVEKVILSEAKKSDTNKHLNKLKSMAKQNQQAARELKQREEKLKQQQDKVMQSKYKDGLERKQASEVEKEVNKRMKVQGTRASIDDNRLRMNNDLPPITMQITINYILKGSEHQGIHQTTLSIGVKSVVHVVDAMEFANFLPRAIKEGSFIFRTIQFTTGEIRFVRDFLLNIGTIKQKANTVGKGKTASRWWHILSRMSKLNKIMGYFNRNKFLPSTTMIISIDDVQNIKTNEGIDILTRESALKLYKVYFLLGLIIVDDHNSLIYMFDEESETFKTVPMGQIQAQAKATAQGDVKSLMNLMSLR